MKMRSENLLSAFENNWLNENELSKLAEGFFHLRHWIQSGESGNPVGISPTVSALFIHSLKGDNQKKEVLSLCSFFLREQASSQWSNEIVFFLDCLWGELQLGRIGTQLEKINEKTSLSHSTKPEDYLSSLDANDLESLYENKAGGQNIDFLVKKLPFPLEVLDPRIVRIPPGKTNELHRHAHETVFIYMQGSGHAKIDEVIVPVKPGDIVFIPRWCRHQSVNEGHEEMVFLAVADFGLTGKSFLGNYLKTARMKY